MDLITENEAVFLKNDSGIFADEDGRKIEWYKVTFADPLTFENHELPYRPSIHDDLEKVQKGTRVIFGFELEPTSKKSRVVVSGIQAK